MASLNSLLCSSLHLILLFLVMSPCAPQPLHQPRRHPRPQPGQQPTPLYTWLVLTWPTSYCSQSKHRCLDRPPTRFTIHGMWPQRGSSGQLPCAKGLPYMGSKIEELSDRLAGLDQTSGLNFNWPNLSCKKLNEEFWQSQWDKHGAFSCLKQRDYFKTALVLFHGVGPQLLPTLARHSISPTTKNPYSVSSIVRALQSHFGVDPFIKCESGLLYEIRFCVDLAGTSLVPSVKCRPSYNNKCVNVYFP